jgi:arginase
VEGTLTALLCRTSDRSADGAAGALALARALGERAEIEPRIVGSPGEPRAARYEDDLRDSRGCLLEAGGQLDDALAAGRRPLLLASDCSICLTTLPVLVRHQPDAWVLWLDAHADFNTPETTPSGFLGGMCLAGACGLWETGLDGVPLDPARVVMCGVRDVDPGERVALATHGVGLVERPSELGGVLEGKQVYVHLDLDVLDPAALPGVQFPAPGGFSDGGLRTLLAQVVEATDLVGSEVTSFTAPALARRFATIIEPLL